MAPKSFIDDLLQSKKIIICGGSGGVGKTTTSAVLGLRAAELGKKTAVLTIDPAKRLANALGLETLGHELQKIDPALGELSAMMLDCKRTFDDLVRRYAPNAAACERILSNRYYQHLSQAMTGSHEYMAMEKLYELHESGEFDCLILDTPPTHNALDFLEAPNRLINFLDDSVLKWFLKPYFAAGKISLKAFKTGGKMVFRVLEHLTGLEVLEDISEFFMAFSEMFSGFKARAQKVREILKSDQTSFILVTSPQALTLNECLFYQEKILEYGLHLGGILVNKWHADLSGWDGNQPGPALERLRQEHPALAQNLLENFAEFRALGLRDKQALEFLRQKTQAPIKPVIAFDQDLCSLEDLRQMAREI